MRECPTSSSMNNWSPFCEPFEVNLLFAEERPDSVSEGLILIVSDPESGVEKRFSAKNADFLQRMKCQPKQPTIPIENISIRHILTRLTKLPSQIAELPPLTVTNRIRIEEFGKQEFFIHHQFFPFANPQLKSLHGIQINFGQERREQERREWDSSPANVNSPSATKSFQSCCG